MSRGCDRSLFDTVIRAKARFLYRCIYSGKVPGENHMNTIHTVHSQRYILFSVIAIFLFLVFLPKLVKMADSRRRLHEITRLSGSIEHCIIASVNRAYGHMLMNGLESGNTSVPTKIHVDDADFLYGLLSYLQKGEVYYMSMDWIEMGYAIARNKESRDMHSPLFYIEVSRDNRILYWINFSSESHGPSRWSDKRPAGAFFPVRSRDDLLRVLRQPT